MGKKHGPGPRVQLGLTQAKRKGANIGRDLDTLTHIFLKMKKMYALYKFEKNMKSC